MKKLIEGIVEFRKKLTDESRNLFAKLALGQKPDALFIACCDSRVVPNLFASTDPGDLFVLRNIGNLVPPSDSHISENSTLAALEFAIFTLNITDIVICGHSECGAIEALLQMKNKELSPHLHAWLSYGIKSLNKTNIHLIPDQALAEHNQISQFNVLQQMEHVRSYPYIQERLSQKKLRLHGWWFDIAKADVYCYEQELKRFVLIEENEAKLILERMAYSKF